MWWVFFFEYKRNKEEGINLLTSKSIFMEQHEFNAKEN